MAGMAKRPRVTPEHITCSTCKESKHRDDFTDRPAKVNGKSSLCRSCANAAARRYTERNPEKRQELNRRAWRFERFQKSKTEMQALYEKKFKRQRGRCAICKTKEYGGNRTRFAFDHNHDTGELRGLLCNSCNYALGHFKDDLTRLESAVKYLREYGR